MKSIINLHFIFLLLLFSCENTSTTTEKEANSININQAKKVTVKPKLDLAQANRLAALPMKCIQTPFPYKSGVVITGPQDLDLPQVHHPAFYGCFDWHSAVHGHWVLVYLLKHFPDLENQAIIRQKLSENLTAENIEKEIAYFTMNTESKNFERAYGWAWLLKLTEECLTWKDEQAQQWHKNLKPLADVIVKKYKGYLPKLNYPIRVGTHTNTAFGTTFAFDYAVAAKDESLKKVISDKARDYFMKDQNCPATWEPSGYDFLSPCLEEAELMQRVLSKEEFKEWFTQFLPGILEPNNEVFKPATVSDRSDGHLVHLDGLNFSRAWCLYPIARQHPEWAHLRDLANEHLAFALPNIVDGDYAGEHWLATFALYALHQQAL